MQVVHWAPADAGPYSCVHCRRSWGVLDGEWVPWSQWHPFKPDRVVEELNALAGVDPERPKVPVCPACGKAEIRLDRSGRVLGHADADGSLKAKTKVPCRGRGYMPRWS